MLILLIITGLAVVLSFVSDKAKTWEGIKKGLIMFFNILPSLFTVLILVSIILSVFSKETIVKWIGAESGIKGYIIASIMGSISLIPGFVAYPLGSMLIKMGVSYPVIAMFITMLMMVGILTLPLEARYFGWRASLIRNTLSFIGAIVIGLTIGFIWKLL